MENNSIGLWEKTSQKGNIYYAGKVDIAGKKYIINLFKVDKADNPKRPDYNVIIKEAKKEEKGNNQMADEVFANFGNANEIPDSEIAF